MNAVKSSGVERATSDPLPDTVMPRVLFLTSEIPQSVNAGSMQLYRVLQGYPADKLMVLGAAPAKDAELLACRYETLKLLTYRLACTRLRRWFCGLNALIGAADLQVRASCHRVSSFRPELVVTVMDKLSHYKHAWAVARRLGIPLMTITMDDPRTFESAAPLFRKSHERLLRRIYRDASLSLGVSHEMSEFLQTEYGRPSKTFYFGAPDGMVPRSAAASGMLKVPGQLTLGYAGSMSLGYREGIEAIGRSLEVAGAVLRVYSRDQHYLVQHANVRQCGFLRPEELWPEVQSTCDAVLLPYAFEGPILNVYRTHFPTKLSEYCWTGMAVVVTGPETATGVKWALRHPEAALLATSGRPDVLVPLLDRLRDNDDVRVKLAAGAARAALQEFDPAQIRVAFQSCLVKAAGPRTEGDRRLDVIG
jgi:hypothetical protein